MPAENPAAIAIATSTFTPGRRAEPLPPRPWPPGSAPVLRRTRRPWPPCWPWRARAPRENSLRLYDEAIEQLSLAGAQAGILNSVAADKAVRDQAQIEAQRVAMAGSALSLNRAVYEALAAIKLSGASPATKHFVERTLLSYRLAGVDKDQATRDHLQKLHEKASGLSLRVQPQHSGGRKDHRGLCRPSWKACPPTTSPAIRPDAEGRVTLTTDPPDMQPVMTFAANRRTAGAHVPGLQYPRLSCQQADSA